ncbi:MAG: hypothetical protein Q9217_005994 [Psora testacea]
MSLPYLFYDLLSEEAEPTHSLYTEIIEAISRDPQQIETLEPANEDAPILYSLTMRSARLAKLFRHLHDVQGKHPQRPSTKLIAHATAKLLLSLTIPLHDLVEAPQLIELLITGILTCLVPQAPSALRNLAGQVSYCGNLPQHLICREDGKAMILAWFRSPVMSNLDPETLASWTEQLAHLVESCPTQHERADLIDRWRSLNLLRTQLKELEVKLSRENVTSVKAPSLANMIPLKSDNKKTNIAQFQSSLHYLPEGADWDHLLAGLERFHLPPPRSERGLMASIAELEGKKTYDMLGELISTFPCGPCFKALSRNSSRPRQTVAVEVSKAATMNTDLCLDILGKTIGQWRVLLSARALQHLQYLEHAEIAPVQRKLMDLASGIWHIRLVKTDENGHALRIPLAKTKSGRAGSNDRFILWQLDIGPSANNTMSQQIIKIWDFGIDSALSKTVGRVAKLQEMYTKETVDRCHCNSEPVNGKWLPILFAEANQTTSANKTAELDVRNVDQDTIDMANKFYALTDPVMQSIIDNDLTAEFPFDLSNQEKVVISHFKTASLILGRSGTGKTACLVFKLVGKYLARQAIVDEVPIRQVFLTRSGLLADKLCVYTRKLISTLHGKAKGTAVPVDVASSARNRDIQSLNARDLKADDFPLVCTFEQFLVILENTMRAEDRQNFNLDHTAQHHLHDQVLETHITHGVQHLVDFQDFRLDYWPYFPKELTRGLAPDLVYPEVMGVIKGSVSSREALTPLSRENYLARHSRLTPHFVSDADRSRVYDVFEAYKATLNHRRQIDHVDRVVRLLKTIRNDASLQKLLASSFEEMYIDEVQDLRGLDIEIPFSFIKDGRAFHFAGDTAQAISQDSTFRFKDIKFLAGQHFGSAGKASNQRELALPEMFTLTTNYRSHQGILGLASLVMHLLYEGFPKTVDKLEPESAVEILIKSNVGLGELSMRSADFGAEQVILVRDQETRTTLQKTIGDTALVLTILQAKGMEFDDVILWDFFSSFQYPGSLRSLNALLKNCHDPLYGEKHPRLYVALTRARLRLFLIESSEAITKPIVKLLTEDVAVPLVDVARPSDGTVSQSNVDEGYSEAKMIKFTQKVASIPSSKSNDQRKWALQAKQQMESKYYDGAALCFRNAGDVSGEMWAKAHADEETGRIAHSEGRSEDSKDAFQRAGLSFENLELVEDAVRVRERMSQFVYAAELCKSHGQSSKAASLYERAGEYVKASECYHAAGMYTEGAVSLRQGNEFDELVFYMSSNLGYLSPDLFRSYSRLCKLLLKQGKISEKMRKYAINILGSPEEQETAFKEYEMHEDLLQLYGRQARYQEQYDLLQQMIRLEDALMLAVGKQLPFSTFRFTESSFLKLANYVYAGYLMDSAPSTGLVAADMKRMSPRVAGTVKSWEQLLKYKKEQKPYHTQAFATVNDTTVRNFLSLQGSLQTLSSFPDLFLVNILICGANVLHYRHVMTESFSMKFMPTRRYWLERLLRELTFVSPFEQDAYVIRLMQVKLVDDHHVSIVKSSLEDLLYHRLGRDWNKKTTSYSSLLEQVQMAKMFGRNLQRRFHRALSNRLHSSPGGYRMQQHLKILQALEWDAQGQSPLGFINNVELFLDRVKTIEGQYLDAMHAITSIFEHITLFLPPLKSIKICPAAFVIPQAWVHIHARWMAQATLKPRILPWEQGFRYRQVLEKVILRFCTVLTTLQAAFYQEGFNLTCGGNKIQPRLFQQRNVDLLLIALANLSATTPASKDSVVAVKKVLEVHAPQFLFRDLTELRQKLLQLSIRYGNKNPLLVVYKDEGQRTVFVELLKQRGVIQKTFNDLRSLMRHETLVRPAEQSDTPNNEEERDDDSTAREKEAAWIIWKFWKERYPKLQLYRTWMEKPKAQVIARFIALSAKYTNNDAMKLVLIDFGVEVQLGLIALHPTVSNNHKKAMTLLDDMEASDPSYEVLGETFERLGYFDRILRAAADTMSPDNLKRLVDGGDASKVTAVFSEVEGDINSAGNGMPELKRILKKLAKKDKASMKVATLKNMSPVKATKRKDNALDEPIVDSKK